MGRYYDDDDDEFDIQIKEGSIEDAEELLARLDQIFVKSPYDIFARDDLILDCSDSKFSMIGFDGGSVIFYFSNGFIKRDKGTCIIDIIIDRRSSMKLNLLFLSKNDNGVAVFQLSLAKNERTLVNFFSIGEGGYSLGRFLATLEAMGVSLPNNFPEHLCNFVNNCINTYNSLLEQEKVIEDDE